LRDSKAAYTIGKQTNKAEHTKEHWQMIMEAPMKSRVNSAGDRKERTAEVLYKNERGISSDSNKRSSLVHAKRT
jgi:hypothetical protein